jgi:hypothetical protein
MVGSQPPASRDSLLISPFLAVSEFASLRQRNGLQSPATETETAALPLRGLVEGQKSTAVARGERYAIYSTGDKNGDVPGDYGLVVSVLSSVIRTAEADLHAAVVDQERAMPLFAKMFD